MFARFLRSKTAVLRLCRHAQHHRRRLQTANACAIPQRRAQQTRSAIAPALAAAHCRRHLVQITQKSPTPASAASQPLHAVRTSTATSSKLNVSTSAPIVPMHCQRTANAAPRSAPRTVPAQRPASARLLLHPARPTQQRPANASATAQTPATRTSSASRQDEVLRRLHSRNDPIASGTTFCAKDGTCSAAGVCTPATPP